MIIGFFGKGGSGKSTVATQMVFMLKKLNKEILAIDADHNLDLSFNLTGGEIPNNINYIGSSSCDIKDHINLEQDKRYSDAFIDKREKCFHINPKDSFTEKYSYEISKNLNLMISGYKTDDVLHEKSCSHSLSSPLKIYLPLLDLQADEYVILDEKAGADGVTTGIVSGVDVAIIVCEPALHSIKAAKQIAELMDFYKTPYLFVGNKITNDEDKNFIKDNLEKEPVTYLSNKKEIKQNPLEFSDTLENNLKEIIKESHKINSNDRKERTYEKYRVNRERK